MILRISLCFEFHYQYFRVTIDTTAVTGTPWCPLEAAAVSFPHAGGDDNHFDEWMVLGGIYEGAIGDHILHFRLTVSGSVPTFELVTTTTEKAIVARRGASAARFEDYLVFFGGVTSTNTVSNAFDVYKIRYIYVLLHNINI